MVVPTSRCCQAASGMVSLDNNIPWMMSCWVRAHLLLMKQKEKGVNFIMSMCKIIVKITVIRNWNSQLLSTQWLSKIKKKTKRIIKKCQSSKKQILAVRSKLIACKSIYLIIWTTFIHWTTFHMSNFNKCTKNLTTRILVLNTRPWLLPTTMTLSWKINIPLNISTGHKVCNPQLKKPINMILKILIKIYRSHHISHSIILNC